MFDPDEHLPRINRGMIYLGACLLTGIRLAREHQVNIRIVPTRRVSDLAHEIFNRVFGKVPEQVKEIH